MTPRIKPLTDRVPPRPIADGVRIGHVHLKVANLDRALTFYCDILGFELTQRRGREAAFLSAGGYHHHIALNTWESLGGSPPPPGDGASDHGVSEALYLRDYDDNGVELCWDRPRELWPVGADGRLDMGRLRLDLQNLLAER
jgi:catechol 2,3-dioxygenase